MGIFVLQNGSKIPLGYRFSPSNSEIVCYYLKNKILGQLLTADFIPIVDVYSKSPDQLPFRDLIHGRENEWYFFTSRPNCRLVTDDGYYYVSKEEKIFNDNKVVGFLRILTYYQGQPPKGRRTNWIVHEFRVNPDIIPACELDDTIQAKMSNFVACKVVHTQKDTKEMPEEADVRLFDSLLERAMQKKDGNLLM